MNADTREKLEEDVREWLVSVSNDSEGDWAYIKDMLDRQAAITKRDTLHDNPTCSGRSTCVANRPISESADRETPDTAGIGASKDEIRDFDVWNVAYEIYCAGGYVDNGNEPNPPTDGIRELLDRQEAIIASQYGQDVSDLTAENVQLTATVDRLTSERDALAHDLAECDENRIAFRDRCHYLEERVEKLRGR